jgi:hypothetical protein
MLRRFMIAALILTLPLAACDGGGGEESNANPEEDVYVPPKQEQPQCTTHTACDYGELCVNKQCAIPEGTNAAPAYDFAAIDQNPTSATSQQEVSLSGMHGKAVLLNFSSTTCAACVADAAVYESMVKQLEYKGVVNAVAMITVVLPNGASKLTELCDGLQFPVVVDNSSLGVADHYKAGKDTLVLIDGAGYVRENWPSLEVRGGAKDKSLLNEKLIELALEVM